MTTVTVLLSPEAVKTLRPGAVKLTDVASESARDVTLTPNDPGAGDSELRRYYSAEAENEAEAERLKDYLLALSAVEGAWIKPKDAPPG